MPTTPSGTRAQAASSRTVDGAEITPRPWTLPFPAEHWDHLRTSNPVESVFATVRHRTVRTKGALSQKTVKLMVFTLIRAASQKWCRLNGANQLPRVTQGVKFTDGVANTDPAKTNAA